MHRITFVSTIHKEIGSCNADELCDIIEQGFQFLISEASIENPEGMKLIWNNKI